MMMPTVDFNLPLDEGTKGHFAEHGFAGTTIAAVAADASTAAETIYATFGSKVALLAAAVSAAARGDETRRSSSRRGSSSCFPGASAPMALMWVPS